jgi:hypothetical protein
MPPWKKPMVNFTLEANLWNKLGTKALKTSRNEDDQGTCFESAEKRTAIVWTIACAWISRKKPPLCMLHKIPSSGNRKAILSGLGVNYLPYFLHRREENTPQSKVG